MTRRARLTTALSLTGVGVVLTGASLVTGSGILGLGVASAIGAPCLLVGGLWVLMIVARGPARSIAWSVGVLLGYFLMFLAVVVLALGVWRLLKH